MSHQFSREWTERQLQSENKWREIREKVKKRIPFDNSEGWNDLIVVVSCGYCKEDPSLECSSCPLKKEKFCISNYLLGRSVFWTFVGEMEKKNPNFRKVLALATKMLIRIREDRPLSLRIKKTFILQKIAS